MITTNENTSPDILVQIKPTIITFFAHFFICVNKENVK